MVLNKNPLLRCIGCPGLLDGTEGDLHRYMVVLFLGLLLHLVLPPLLQGNEVIAEVVKKDERSRFG